MLSGLTWLLASLFQIYHSENINISTFNHYYNNASDKAHLSMSSRLSTGEPNLSLSRRRRSGMPTQKWSLPTVILKLCSKEESERRPGDRLYKSKR